MTESEFHLQIAEKLGGINEALKALPKIEHHLAVQNNRIGKVEKEIGTIKTKVAVVASLFGTGAVFAWDFIKYKFLK